MKVSRRQLLLSFAGLAAGVRAFPATLPTGNTQCRYRVDAALSIFGASLITIRGVGSAAAMLEQREEDSHGTVNLRFAGGSDRQRAHGIVYAGSLEESASHLHSALCEVNYFGFVTASPSEKSDAQQFAEMKSRTGCVFVAVEGRHELGAAHSKRATVSLPAANWPDLDGLCGQVRTLFSTQEVTRTGLSYPDAVPATFLYTVYSAIRSPQNRVTLPYVHNGRLYRLETEKSIDASGLARLNGKIHDLSKKSTSTFRLWSEPSSDLPVRIEFQARSCLRLILEKEPS
jgi:hypothetical protein